MKTYQDRFIEACKNTEFAAHENMIGGYYVWDVKHVCDGQKVTLDGPFYTEDEARISADLMRGTFRGARACQVIHCWAWNPDPRREKAIRDDALASRMMLAVQIGVNIPTHITRDE